MLWAACIRRWSVWGDGRVCTFCEGMSVAETVCRRPLNEQWSSLVARSCTPGGVGDGTSSTHAAPRYAFNPFHPVTRFIHTTGRLGGRGFTMWTAIHRPSTLFLSETICITNYLLPWHECVLTSHHQIITCLKKACDYTIVPITRHRRTLCSRGCRGRKTFTGREYTLLFKGGTLSTTMQTTLKNMPSATLQWSSVKVSYVQLLKSIKLKTRIMSFRPPLVIVKYTKA